MRRVPIRMVGLGGNIDALLDQLCSQEVDLASQRGERPKDEGGQTVDPLGGVSHSDKLANELIGLVLNLRPEFHGRPPRLEVAITLGKSGPSPG
jgi:hypothetical protein